MASGAERQASDRAERTVLVIDDDADQRAVVAELLSHHGYVVVAASDGQEALDQLAGGLRPKLIVLDLTMPRMDGWSFLRHLRGAVRSIVPVVVMSAVSTGTPPRGADACLEKPLDASEFCSVVARFCAGAREMR
jgi:two-component system, chemotaxis family, chemotaxis protein CheY